MTTTKDKFYKILDKYDNIDDMVANIKPDVVKLRRLLSNENISISSIYEKDILAELKTFGYDTENINVGIRCHDIKWHTVSDTLIDKRQSNIAKETDDLQFTSSEFSEKKDIVMSIILSKLGYGERIYARQCQIKELTPKDYTAFSNKYHLQGHGQANIKIGLFYKDELISVMSFGKSRFNKNVEYEMVRYCVKSKTNVIGGASKLFKYFIRQYDPKSIITFADARISRGKLYEKLGFTLKRQSEPNYFYTSDFVKFYSRVKFQKHKLPDLLANFDPSKTEKENMTANGYYIFYDAGNLVFEWVKE